jgi:hypothetical protein
MKTDSGNVLFLILIAVALFAALSYAVTSSTRSGGGDASGEKAALAASQILQYASSIETAVVRVQVGSSCAPTQISFANPVSASGSIDYTNPTAPPDFRCHVFSPQGGGAIFNDLKGIVTRYEYTGSVIPDQFYFSPEAIPGAGTAAPDLILFIYGGISRAVCSEINRKLGVVDNGATVPAWESDTSLPFTGDFSSSAGYAIQATGGATSFCAYDQSHDIDNNGAFAHVLLPR